MPKAPVFPVPVCAVPKMSLPSNATGIALACIGVGVLKLIFASDSTKVDSNLIDKKFSIKAYLN